MPSLASIRNKATQYISKGEYEKAVKEYNKALEVEPNDANTHNLLGEAYLKMGKREGAISEFEKALELYTKDAFYTNAIAVCRKMLRLDADRAEVYRELGDLYGKQGLLGEAIGNLMEYSDRKRAAGDMDEVFKTYHKTIDLMPKKTDIRMKLVDMYLAKEKTSEAVEELKKVREIFREQGKVDDADGIESRIEALVGTAETVAPEAEVGVAEAGEILPPPLEVPAAELGDEIRFEQMSSDLVAEAVVPTLEIEPAEIAPPPLSEEELLQERVSGIESLIYARPADWASYVQLGDLSLAIGASDDAINHYYRAADAYYDEKSYEKAEDLYRRVADLRPFELRPRQRLVQSALQQNDTRGTVDAYVSLGDCLRRRGAAGEAELVYRKALKLDPDNSLVRQKVGKPVGEVVQPVFEERVGVEVEARPEEPPTPVEEFVDFAGLLKEEVDEMARGPRARAELPTMEKLAEEFKEEIYSKIEEGDYSAHYDLGVTYREMGLVDEAIAEFEIASRGQKERLKSLEVLGLCYLERGDLKLAEEQTSRGLALEGHTDEEKIGLHYHLGLVCERMGRVEDAEREYRRVFTIDKSFKDISERLRKTSKK